MYQCLISLLFLFRQKSVTSKDDSGEAIKILTTEDSNLPPNEKGEVGQMSMDINDTPKLGWKAPLVYLKIVRVFSNIIVVTRVHKNMPL